jgi:hypothetical protein
MRLGKGVNCYVFGVVYLFFHARLFAKRDKFLLAGKHYILY